MPARLEVWEIFLDHGIQMAQTVGWKDGNAKIRELAVTRGGFAESLFSYKTALHRQIPWMHTLPLSSKIFLLPHQEAQGSATCSWKLLETLDALGGQWRQPRRTSRGCQGAWFWAPREIESRPDGGVGFPWGQEPLAPGAGGPPGLELSSFSLLSADSPHVVRTGHPQRLSPGNSL